MPARNIDAAVRHFAPEHVLCWCNGQSLESRYSSSAGGGGAAAAGKAVGTAVLGQRLARARAARAVRMPRFPVVAVGASQIFVFDGPVATRGPFAALPRDQVQVEHGGSAMWRRLDLIVSRDGEPCCYTMMVSALGGGRKRLQALVSELARTAS
jgi:hypothetical protein